ncbi:hypothetical protein BaRGS_00019749 [Batillaria attramentaria]|uniref:Uncharacterized protein n=1 Tax=Batillaria attramentaria TaxID=370345 RepID=A0ABD0KQ72_9CAEN
MKTLSTASDLELLLKSGDRISSRKRLGLYLPYQTFPIQSKLGHLWCAQTPSTSDDRIIQSPATQNALTNVPTDLTLGWSSACVVAGSGDWVVKTDAVPFVKESVAQTVIILLYTDPLTARTDGGSGCSETVRVKTGECGCVWVTSSYCSRWSTSAFSAALRQMTVCTRMITASQHNSVTWTESTDTARLRVTAKNMSRR